MGTRTISISDVAYERLSSRKKERESFSEVIKRLTGKKSLTEFAGVFGKREGESLERNIRKSRAASRKRMRALE